MDQLPIDAYQAEILTKIQQNDVLIITGDTGCGKSSRVPQMLASITQKTIFATQPRRIAAISLSERVAKEMGDVNEKGIPLLQRVGYAVGQDRKYDDRTAKVVFVTCGWAVQKFIHDPEYIFKQCDILMIDEAHEREIDMDLLCLLGKTLLAEKPKGFKIVLMSATLDSEIFKGYFPGSIDSVNINMRRYPVTTYHLDEFQKSPLLRGKKNFRVPNASSLGRPNEVTELYRCCLQMCRFIYDSIREPSTVLVFFDGMSGIDEVYEMLFQQDPNSEIFEIFILHSLMEKEEQMAVFAPLEAGEKYLRIVLSTNIAESSVTIPDVQYVLDFGTHKIMKHNEQKGMMTLSKEWVSKASSDQRQGRTGRVCPGTIFRFYSTGERARFRDHDEAEILLVPLEDTVLKLFSLKKQSKIQLFQHPLQCLQQIVDPPSGFEVTTAYRNLLQLGALAQEDDSAIDSEAATSITELGEKVMSLPLSLEHAKFMLFGAQFSTYLVHFAIMVAFINSQDIFLMPNYRSNDQKNYLKAVRCTTRGRQSFDKDYDSDLLAVIGIFREYLTLDRSRKSKELRTWLNQYGLHQKRMYQFSAMVYCILERLSGCGFAKATEVLTVLHRNGYVVPANEVDKAIPMSQVDVETCSLLVGLALNEEKYRLKTSYGGFQPHEQDEFKVYCQLEGKPQGDEKEFIKLMVHSRISPVKTVKFGEHGRVCFSFESPVEAHHILRSLFYHDRFIMQVTKDIKIIFTRPSYTPDVYSWSTVNHRRVFDYPPKSACYHRPPDFQNDDEEESVDQIAVTPAIYDVGRASKVSYISMIRAQHQVLYAVLSRASTDEVKVTEVAPTKYRDYYYSDEEDSDQEEAEPEAEPEPKMRINVGYWFSKTLPKDAFGGHTLEEIEKFYGLLQGWTKNAPTHHNLETDLQQLMRVFVH